ncbi:hypothetical protein C8R45DRAFT_1076831 [Mycena sanguinolenta]|nr:hypothetical protein C8R45DRAFT_1076831 [Mycena sanguinolenta]
MHAHLGNAANTPTRPRANTVTNSIKCLNTVRPAFLSRKIRHKSTLSLRWQRRRRKIRPVISYLDIEEAQYQAEIEKYMTSYGDHSMLPKGPANTPGCEWNVSDITDITEGVGSMSLWASSLPSRSVHLAGMADSLRGSTVLVVHIQNRNSPELDGGLCKPETIALAVTASRPAKIVSEFFGFRRIQRVLSLIADIAEGLIWSETPVD